MISVLRSRMPLVVIIAAVLLLAALAVAAEVSAHNYSGTFAMSCPIRAGKCVPYDGL